MKVDKILCTNNIFNLEILVTRMLINVTVNFKIGRRAIPKIRIDQSDGQYTNSSEET